MRNSNRFDRDGNRVGRPARRTARPARRRAEPRAAEMPRLHRGEDREACEQQAGGRGGGRGPRRGPSPRARDQYTEQQYDRMEDELPDADVPRGRGRGRRSMPRGPAMASTRPRPRRMARMNRRAYDRGTQRGRGAAEDELMDMDLDAILEVDESEIEEGFGGGGLGDDMGAGDDLANQLSDEPMGDTGAPEGELAPETVTEIAEEVAEEVVETLQEEGVIDKPKGDKSGDKGSDADDKKPAKPKADDKDDKSDDDDKDDDDKDDKDDKKEASAASSAAKWAPLFTEQDVARLDREAEVTLVPFLNQQDPSYSVLANGRPVGEIRESDLTDVDLEDRRAMFVDPSFPKGIVQAASQLGVDKILGDLNLRYYANIVTASQANAAAKNAVQSDLEEAFQTRAASLKQDFINNVLLAVQASTKNVFVQNPLRDAVRKNFREAGVPDALVVDLFEDAVQTAGADYFLAMVNQADEWLGFEKEAMAQIESTINSAQYSHPVDRGMEVEAEAIQPGTAGQLVAGAPPSMQLPQTMQPQPQVGRQAAAPVDSDELAMDDVRNIMRNSSSLLRGTRR